MIEIKTNLKIIIDIIEKLDKIKINSIMKIARKRLQKKAGNQYKELSDEEDN